VRDGTFTEQDVRSLLIDLRDSLSGVPLIQEVAHFVAHPKGRNRGIFVKELNLQLWKFKRAAGADATQISVNRIECGIYDKISLGISQLPEDVWPEKVGITADKASNIFRDAYEKGDGCWLLKTGLPKQCLDKVIRVIDTVLRNIYVRHPLSASAVVQELSRAISWVLGNAAREDHMGALIREQTDVMICAMSIMQGVPLEFDGGLTGYLEWSPSSLDPRGQPIDELCLLAVLEGPGFVAFALPFATAETPGSPYGVQPSAPGLPKHYTAQRDQQGKLSLVFTGETRPFQR
jgi:hypothetical protein